MNIRCVLLAAVMGAWAGSCAPEPVSPPAPPAPTGPAAPAERRVGSPEAGVMIIPTGQAVRPVGETLTYSGRPLDLALSPDGSAVYVKDTVGLTILDAKTWKIRQHLPFKDDSGSMHGIATAKDGRIFITGAKHTLWEAKIDAKGKAAWSRAIPLPGPKDDSSHSLGLAISADNRLAYVCMSRNNTLAVVDLAQGKVVRSIDVGICPYDVELADGRQTAYVSNFGGSRPKRGEKTADTAGSEMVVDQRGIGTIGSVSVVNLATSKAEREIIVGLHPADLLLDGVRGRLWAANANSDSVSLIDTKSGKVVEEIGVRPDPALPFGSVSNALAMSADGTRLFVADGGNNAVAVVDIAGGPGQSRVLGFIPTAWFPGALAMSGHQLIIANLKGDGSRDPSATKQGGAFDRIYNSRRYVGSISRVDVSTLTQLPQWTRQVRIDSRVPQALRAAERAGADEKPVPIPQKLGQPSVFEHVVYVLKENRTYDQLFGDMKQANGDAALCIYGREITPNHHALAEEFALLDNYYCNGVVSADGHQWAMQGMVTSYQEKGIGASARSYDFGTDALCYASSNFVWDSVLLAGLSFRNYGEFDFPTVIPSNASWFDLWNDRKTGANKTGFTQSVKIDTLKRYTSTTFPGWEMRFSDQYRMDQFLKEFAQAEKSGHWPNVLIVYLPQDHTAGRTPSAPSPRAHLADNDLALGRLVDAISHSRFWSKTCIFVNEDDPQSGFDHVDGHRSICLVVSPYTRRRAVVHDFYNQSSVLHTLEKIFGLPPMNQQVAQSPTMEACFTNQLDLTPYKVRPNRIALDERDKPASAMTPAERALAVKGQAMDLTMPDRINDDLFNRILWQAERGPDVPYPAQLAGAHGKALPGLGLKLDPHAKHDDDDDDDDRRRP